MNNGRLRKPGYVVQRAHTPVVKYSVHLMLGEGGTIIGLGGRVEKGRVE